MKKIRLLIIILLFFTVSKSQNKFSYGVIPSKSVLIGFETGGSYMVVQPEYSATGEKMKFFVLRSVPKIAYAPFKNLLTGIYYEYEFLNIDGKRDQTIMAFGSFIRYYLPVINKYTKTNNVNFLKDRLFFFSELYAGKSNIILLDNGDTASTDGFNTIFYGIKLGVNFRIIKKLFVEFALVQNFDNRNGDFQTLHPELGFEYFINKDKQKDSE